MLDDAALGEENLKAFCFNTFILNRALKSAAADSPPQRI